MNVTQTLGMIRMVGSAFWGAGLYGGGLDFTGKWRSAKRRARNRRLNKIAGKSRARNRK